MLEIYHSGLEPLILVCKDNYKHSSGSLVGTNKSKDVYCLQPEGSDICAFKNKLKSARS